jgi:hypothetical protein
MHDVNVLSHFRTAQDSTIDLVPPHATVLGPGDSCRHLLARLAPCSFATLASNISAYAITLALVATAAALRLLLDQIAPGIPPFTTFYPVLVIAGFIGGVGPALLALLSSAALAWWAFFPPRWTFFTVPDFASLLGLLVFASAGACIIWVTAAYHGALRSLKNEQESRDLLNRELIHRGRNMSALAQSVVRQTLHDDQATAEKLNGRLSALYRSSEVLIASSYQTGSLDEIIAAELLAYGQHRVSLRGPKVALPSDLVRALALVIHELATNAAKYGAFSVPEGRVEILWAVEANASIR